MFSLSCGSLIIARFIEQSYIPLMMYFIIIWTVDTMALVGGKTIGGVKLAPKISPNKTWSGLIIGSISSGVAASLLTYLPNYDLSLFSKIGIHSVQAIFIFAMFLAIISQISDLFMSFFKRKFNIKDSGSIIPGHGGMIDRFDSIILTAPIILYALL
jgi:phosphatidate cytidylyltransferase